METINENTSISGAEFSFAKLLTDILHWIMVILCFAIVSSVAVMVAHWVSGTRFYL